MFFDFLTSPLAPTEAKILAFPWLIALLIMLGVLSKTIKGGQK